MTIFERVKELSDSKGYNLQFVAKKAGLGVNAIYKWQKSAPSADKLESVAQVLDVSVDYLLGKDNVEQKSERDLEVEEAINSMRSYQGKEISESQREVLRGIIKGYLDNQGK